jgi:hypothetical protein
LAAIRSGPDSVAISNAEQNLRFSRIAPSKLVALSDSPTNKGKIAMKLSHTFAVAVAIGALAACNQSPREQAADNIEANAEMQADNLEEVADNASNEAVEDNLENQADATREAGEQNADATRDGADADGNSAN